MRTAASPGSRTPRPGPRRRGERSCDLFVGARTGGGCWPARFDLGLRWPARLVATAAEDRPEHLTTHSVAGIDEPLALACSQGLPGPSPEDLMGWPGA